MTVFLNGCNGFAQQGGEARNEECAICQDAINYASEKTVWFPCRHVYHEDCVLGTATLENGDLVWKCCQCKAPVKVTEKYRKILEDRLPTSEKGRNLLQKAVNGMRGTSDITTGGA